jgi:hypothetical protein
LRDFSHDQDSRVTLAAAQALAELSDRAALTTLVKLLAADDERVRARSTQILRAWTGQNFAFNPYAELAEREAALARWQTWLAAEGRTARLHAPLALQPLPEDLGTGLLVHFTFDGDAGERINDSGVLGRHGTLHNRTAFIPHRDGQALKLRGEGEYGDAGGHAILPFVAFSKLEEFTLAIWVRETGMTHHEGEAYVTYGTDRGVGTEDALGIAHFNGSLIFRVGDGQVSIPYDSADRGRWVHYAITYRAGRLSAFRDSRLVGETRARVCIDGERAAIGRHWWSGGVGTSSRLQGAVDELRVYSRALSPEQIARLMAATD